MKVEWKTHKWNPVSHAFKPGSEVAVCGLVRKEMMSSREECHAHRCKNCVRGLGRGTHPAITALVHARIDDLEERVETLETVVERLVERENLRSGHTRSGDVRQPAQR